MTIEQAAELVKSSIGDVFSRDAVLSLLDRLKVSEDKNLDVMRTLIVDHKRVIRDEAYAMIENNWDELVDFSEVEFRIEGHNEIVLQQISMCKADRIFRDLADNIVDMLLEGVNELEEFETMEASLNEMSNSNTESDEQCNL